MRPQLVWQRGDQRIWMTPARPPAPVRTPDTGTTRESSAQWVIAGSWPVHAAPKQVGAALAAGATRTDNRSASNAPREILDLLRESGAVRDIGLSFQPGGIV
ncbi:hypothetical protein Acsp05_33430 [Actinokineospora sp. NBRC 105648]|nr:hypothetical protein Acsp05_33430 [Actinokineospora sp. NBRC 105648]